MSNEQKNALLDIKAFIDFAIENDEPFFRVLGTIGHDVNGLFDGDEHFLPRTSGYAEKAG